MEGNGLRQWAAAMESGNGGRQWRAAMEGGRQWRAAMEGRRQWRGVMGAHWGGALGRRIGEALWGGEGHTCIATMSIFASAARSSRLHIRLMSPRIRKRAASVRYTLRTPADHPRIARASCS